MTTWVVDMGSANIKILIMISAEHIYVEPRVMKPVLRLVTPLKLMVLVTVCTRVYLLMSIIPSASNIMAMYMSCLRDSFLFTYATPMIFERLIAPMQKPVMTAKTKLQ